MSRKTNRLKRRNKYVTDQLAKWMRLAVSRGETVDKLYRELSVAKEAVATLATELQARKEVDKETAGYRVAVRNLGDRAWGRMGGEVLSLSVAVGTGMLRHGILCGGNRGVFPGNPMGLSRELHFICQDMAHKMRDALVEKLTKDGMLV